ncbi:MAG: hypothetical protein EBT55_01450, partial [Proteobacteria bacterium]|nr:hypothetical protein [Pseudomonadota bacterium]
MTSSNNDPNKELHDFHQIHLDSEQNKSKEVSWLNSRLPILSTVENALKKHPYPKNLSYWWNFGSIAGIALLVQILSGLFLAM